MKNPILVCFAKEMPSIERKRTTKNLKEIQLIKKDDLKSLSCIGPLQLQPKFQTLFIYVAQGPWCASEIHTGFNRLTQLHHLYTYCKT